MAISILALSINIDCRQVCRQLWIQDPQPRDAPLFRLENRAFSSDAVMTIIRARLRTRGIQNYASFTGHSFRRGAAQSASDIGLPESDIQALRRWASDAFGLYSLT
jgi:integrase